MDIQWFPGHMTKTKRLIKENIKKIDVVIEILDARAPLASRNPLIEEMTGHKPRVIILNKEDLADPGETDRWMNHFKGKETLPLKISCSKKKGLDRIPKAARSVCRKKNPNASIRVMVVGIPNVGKSTLINALVRKKKAAVGNTPGLTRGIQLINLPGNIQLIDTPGILWHKFDDQVVGQRLAIIGTIKTTILPQLELARSAFEIFRDRYPHLLTERFNLEEFPESWELLLEQIGRKRGCLVKGGGVDLEKAAVQFLRDIREGKVGRFTLETMDTSGQSDKKEEENS